MADNYSKPFNSDDMVYDSVLHQYILTPKVVKDLGGNYKDDRIQERTLKAISRRVYGWVYKTTNSHNRYYVEFELACNSLVRSIIEEALKAQLEADIASGFNDIPLQSPINFVNGNIIPRNIIEQNMIAPEAEYAIRSFSNPNLLFAGDYGIRFESRYPNRYTEWEY